MKAYDIIVVLNVGENVDFVKRVANVGGGLLEKDTRYISPDVFARNFGALTGLGRDLEGFVREPAYPQDETKTSVYPSFVRKES